MTSESKRKQPLKIEVVDGILSISIGVDTLAHAIHWCPSLSRFDEENDEYIKPKIHDPDLFAKSIAYGLHDEEEDGSTPVTDLLDGEAHKALEFGAEGIDIDEIALSRALSGEG